MFTENLSRLHYFYFDFLLRHSFRGEDVAVLRSKYPQVSFNGIPDSWILVLDDMVEDILFVNRGASVVVSQEFGFLNVRFLGLDRYYDYEPIIHDAENRLYSLDIDLHRQLGYQEWWNVS